MRPKAKARRKGTVRCGSPWGGIRIRGGGSKTAKATSEKMVANISRECGRDIEDNCSYTSRKCGIDIEEYRLSRK